MNCILKITVSLLFFWVVFSSDAQSERNRIPFSNKVLFNPSYAGLFENKSVWTGLQFFTQPDRNVYNEYTLTYDKYSDKIKGGVAYYFRQGLTGNVNINTSELGIAISRHFEVNRTLLIPSLNLNLEFASKQWYVTFIDHILAKEFEPPSPPGQQFSRFYRFKPRLGFLFDSRKYQAGISAQIPFGNNLANDGESLNLNNPVIIGHIAKKIDGQKKGLVSLPFSASPEIIFLYSETNILTRVSLNIEEVKHAYSLFLQNDFKVNLYGIGGSFIWKIENIKLSLSAGLSHSSVSNQLAFFGETRLGIIIPPVLYSEKRPWAPIKKSF